MMKRISGKRPVKFRAHVDHIDNANGRVCAIRFGRRYLTVSQITFLYLDHPLEFGPRRVRQPRLSIDGVGTIWLSKDRDRIVVT
jgi:hypothetical protein